MRFERVGDILPTAIEQLGLTAGVQRALALLRWADAAAEVLPGAEAASQAVDLRQGRLVVVVRSPPWSQELHLRHPDLILALNRRLGQPIVRGITFRIGMVTAGATDERTRAAGA